MWIIISIITPPFSQEYLFFNGLFITSHIDSLCFVTISLELQGKKMRIFLQKLISYHGVSQAVDNCRPNYNVHEFFLQNMTSHMNLRPTKISWKP